MYFQHYGVTQQHTISKAVELFRLLKLKIPGSLGQGEICRPAVCLELACQIVPGSKVPARTEFIRYSCSGPKVYNETFTRIQRMLDVSPVLDLRELVTLFGCSQLHDNTRQLLDTYWSRLLESLTYSERARVNLSRPPVLAAAFLLTAKKHRVAVDRAALMGKMGITRAELLTALDDFCVRCEDQLAPAATRRQGRNKGKMVSGDADGQSTPRHNIEEPGENDVPRSSSKRRRRTMADDYDDDEAMQRYSDHSCG
ncbi:hypothetical protein Vretifemale_20104 [Volvox reticuliferus]|uniref:Origin recognition complex subunit 6 n=1 Tax=Volvox reticuliferus TaxID=1737510 RepID=A0A8J4FX05_9CHLO|nr:hypothetical protein Vretifemale_20104 [Volvox reticuliferus]